MARGILAGSQDDAPQKMILKPSLPRKNPLPITFHGDYRPAALLGLILQLQRLGEGADPGVGQPPNDLY